MPETRRHSEAPGTRQEDLAGSEEHRAISSPNEGEIDQILADSFPASDTPPWTLSVAEAGRSQPPHK